MNYKKEILFLTLIVTLIGIIGGVFNGGLFSKQLNNKNEFNPIESYPVIQSINYTNSEIMDSDKYLILYDEDDEVSILDKNNMIITMNYIKKIYDVVEIKDFEGITQNTSAIIVTFEDLSKFHGIEEIMDYTKEGGGLLLTQRMHGEENYDKYKDIIGIKNVNKEKAQEGIELIDNLLIGAKGFKTSSAIIMNSSFEVTLKEDAKIYAKTYEGIPLIWEVAYGDGNIVVNNGSMLGEEWNRGIVVGELSLLESNFIYPINNTKAVFLDDFPAPIPNKGIDSVFQGVEVSIDQFYRMIWWPNMLKLAQQDEIKYSGVVIENYSDKVNAPFGNLDQTSEESLFFFGKEIINQGGEIGIHGYNHQSLTYNQEDVIDEDYKAWESEKDIKESLMEVKNFVGNVFPKYELRSYVPPSNILSKEVRKQFPSIMPEIKVISSLYKGQENGSVYTQEFEVASDGIIEFPRISSGYIADDDSMWNIYNGISLHGIISHFIHPDDLFDTNRSGGLNWEEMYESLASLFDELYEKYEWIRPMTVSDAAEEVMKHEISDVYISESNNRLNGYINNFRKDMYFILRTNKIPQNTEQCTVKEIDQDTYLVYTQSPEFSIELLEGGRK